MAGLGVVLGATLEGAGRGMVSQEIQNMLDRRERALAAERAKHEGYTLGPGDVRYDNAGKVVARGPDKPAERGRIITPQPGGSAYRENADGSIEPLIVRNPGDRVAGSPVNDGLARVTSIEQARKLAPGTRFIDPDGVVRMVPGGGGSNATGGFPDQ